jgi:hypothetical protein
MYSPANVAAILTEREVLSIPKEHIPVFPTGRSLPLCIVFLVLGFVCPTVSNAQAGPPYLTDDPDPVPLHHFEAYAFELSDGTPAAGTALAGPSFEMNWGAAPNLQLHLVIPFVNVYTSSASATHGFGDIELGAKYKFFDETKHRPEIGVFPFIELPAGDASRGLGVGSAWYRVPVWIKKGFGNWSVYTGGGEVFAHGNDYKNYPFVGGLLQRKVNNKLTLGGELFAHAAEGSGPSAIGSATLADFGGFYSLTQHFQLMAAAGHSIVNGPETYTYLAAYWTWGRDKPPPHTNPPASVHRPGMM